MEEYICKYCSKKCKNKNSLVQHEIRCKENPNRIKVISNFIKYNEKVKNGEIDKIYKNQFIKAEKLGLSKPKISDETKNKLSTALKGRKLTEEWKNKIRKTQQKNYKGKTRWYTQIQHRLSYAEQYFVKIFPNAKQHYHVNRYFLDFAYPSHKLYIEIDGEQHKRYLKNIEHDKIRTEILKNEGWTLYKRIYWPDFKKMKRKDQENFIMDILNELKKLNINI